jgi:S1-C subfamily serine protease
LAAGATVIVVALVYSGSDKSIPAPGPSVLDSPGYIAAKTRVVKIRGTASSCGRYIEGSGFVFAPDRIMTNAHVVAGVDEGLSVTTIAGKAYKNVRVVLYDPQVDVAVLYVPGLNLKPLTFDTSAQPGDNAVIAGHPLNGPFAQDAARIDETVWAKGPNIYGTGTVDRHIFQARGLSRLGNSGGPLLSPSGTVDGVMFAVQETSGDTAFALTASEVSADASAGAHQMAQVSTGKCDN